MKKLLKLDENDRWDLDGIEFAMGGMLAYEVTRQLQEMGDTVNTIVMLDSLFTSEFKEMELSTNNKQAMLGAANNALQAWIQGSPEKFHQTFIHRDEVENFDDESFLDQLVNLAKQRGLPVDAKQLRRLILKDKEAQQAYLRIFTDQLNAHIKKQASKNDIPILWGPSVDGGTNGTKLQYVEKHYSKKFTGKDNHVFCIITDKEPVKTVSSKEIKSKTG
jgi:hypothetical protein